MDDQFLEFDKSNYCRLLGKNLSTLRQQANISQEDLCTRLGFSRQSLSNYETGRLEMKWIHFVAIVLFFYLYDDTRVIMETTGIVDEYTGFILDLNKKSNKTYFLRVRPNNSTITI